MKVTIMTDVSQEVLDRCSRELGTKVTKLDPKEADVQIIYRNFEITPSLKLIQTISAGVDHLNFHKIPENVLVCSNAGAFAEPVAEHAMAMLLSWKKKICGFHNMTQSGVYRKEPVSTILGKTVGIIGHGGIGRSFARMAKGFGMRVIAYTRTPREDTSVDRFVNSLEEVVSLSDIILISLPLTRQTRGIINGKLLGNFRGDTIINVGRADVVNRQDMLAFLENRPDAAYLTDVWWDEPNVKFPIPRNVMLTPHVGGISKELEGMAIMKAVENVKRYMEGRPGNVVNRSEYL
ncbi:MAG TPA: 2-hydroxyacid dehydrogenase [Thermoplasmataceae archaeon]|nr:2-hydroxyacid dehydrogenase [Thermoplasmatales archaeon AK]HLH85872.1 2-hydroxyacid dehydrogenase [Thermoplasmataceae archaeon]